MSDNEGIGAMNKAMYYVPITGSRLSVFNIHVLPLLLQLRCYGQLAGSGLHINVTHPRWVGDVDESLVVSVFHKALLIDVCDSPGFSYRMGTLKLDGKLEGKDIFALLELNMGMLTGSPNQNLKLTLSPVPFGLNGCPKLPYNKGDEMTMFLQVVKAVLNLKRLKSPGCLVDEVRKTTRNLSFNIPCAERWLSELLKLALIRKLDFEEYESIVASGQFEETFGVELPREAEPVKQSDPWRPGKEE